MDACGLICSFVHVVATNSFCPCLNQEGGCYIWVVQHIRVFVLGGPRPKQCKKIDWVALCAYWSATKFQATCGHLGTTQAQVKYVSKSGCGGLI